MRKIENLTLEKVVAMHKQYINFQIIWFIEIIAKKCRYMEQIYSFLAFLLIKVQSRNYRVYINRCYRKCPKKISKFEAFLCIYVYTIPTDYRTTIPLVQSWRPHFVACSNAPSIS